MPSILGARLQTDHTFPPGEQLMLALGLAAADLGALSTEIMDRHSLTHAQYNVLRILAGAGEGGLFHADIGRRMVVGVPDVTRLMDRLAARGLARRERDPRDRRRVVHRIEPAGLDLLATVEPEMTALHAWIEQEMPPSRRERLVGLCEDVIALAAHRSGRTLPGA